jgi:hypothetical protein
MKLWKVPATVLLAAALVSLAQPVRAADEANSFVYATFYNPVEIPGKVLPAGLYAFKIVDDSGPTKVIQVLVSLPSGSLPPSGSYASSAPMPVTATILAVPNYRVQAGRNAAAFYRARPGTTAALRAILPSDVPGKATVAWVLVYPQARAAELAKAGNQPVPSMASEPSSDVNAMKSTEVKAVTPDGQEVEVATAFGKPGDTPAPARRPAGNEAQAQKAEAAAEQVAITSVPGVHGIDIMAGGKPLEMH